MNILLTNDDGIQAPGIAALHTAVVDPTGHLGGPLAGPTGNLLVVAPLTVQSATGHGVTFREPLMVREEKGMGGLRGVAVDGRPADCVKLAVSSIWGERFGAGTRPTLLLSGMNAGANCGINVIYSGTVAAALEGAFLGIPSIAVSLHIGPRGRPRYDVAAAHARRVIERILEHELPRHCCLSINVPVTNEEGPLPPVRVCPMNIYGHVDSYERRESPMGDSYYWSTGHGLDFHATEPGSDVDELVARAITVTPLHYDLTRHDVIGDWRQRLASD